MAKNRHPTTHSRLPSFVKGKLGVIDTYHGSLCHDEALAYGRGEVPEHVYAVKFLMKDLWGPDAERPDEPPGTSGRLSPGRRHGFSVGP